MGRKGTFLQPDVTIHEPGSACPFPSQMVIPECMRGQGSTQAEGVICELRIYSLERALQGCMDIIAARQVFGASCLTTIQFSPTSRHVMLAYGR